MSALRILRLLMLCALVALLWPRQKIVLGQFPDECQAFQSDQECCVNSCTNPDKCIDAVLVSTGDGTESLMLETVSCTANPGNPPGVCNSFQNYVPVDDAACVGGPGSFCLTDDDCNSGLYCNEKNECDYLIQ